MEFKCINNFDNKAETWKAKIKSYNTSENFVEMHIESRSSLHIIIGKSELGNFVSIPNFQAGCYLSKLNDLFWNTEMISSIIGPVDGITVATAISYIDKHLGLKDFN